MNVIKIDDFGEALSWMQCDRAVTLTLNGVERIYYRLPEGDIVCIPNRKKHLAYKVKEFKIDAVLSMEWAFIDAEIKDVLNSLDD